MTSVRNLKKDINYVLSDIIEECYMWQLQQKDDSQINKAEKIIDEAITTFDDLIEKVNDKNTDNRKAHFTAINKELEDRANNLLQKIQKL